MNDHEANSKRFAVALSFPGQHRQFIRNVANRLAEVLGRDRVFYDEWYESELAGADGDNELRRIYRDQSELVVPFFSEHYEKPWCQLEWSAIRSILLNRRKAKTVIPVQLDGTRIEGWEDVDFAIRRMGRSGKQIADVILEIYEQRRQQSPAATTAARTGVKTGTGKPNNLPMDTLGSRFKGRDEFLADVRRALTGEEGAAAITAATALHGMGGVGKTRAAIEYAWRFEAEYNALLFLPADSPANLLSSLAGLTDDLPGLAELSLSPDDVRIGGVIAWLQENGGWLAILDNVDTQEAAAAVRRWLPKLRGGHLLITSRISKWTVPRLALEVLSEDAAADYLLETTADDRRRTDDDDRDARRAANELGGLAIGLEHAAAYIVNHELSLAEYLAEYEQNAAAVLAEFDTHLIDYPHEILSTWLLSVRQLSAEARKLLEVLCWFAPDDIPESLLAEVPDDFPVSRPRDALSELVRYSLVRRDRQETPAFGLHRLVAITTRHHLEQSQSEGITPARDTLATAARWINAALTGHPQDVRTWPHLDPLRPHAEAIADRAEEAGLVGEGDPTSRLMTYVGLLYQHKARYSDAEPPLRRALAIDEQSYGAEHPDVAIDLNNLAVLLQATNRLAEAEPLMRRALAIDEQSYGAEHPNVAIRLNNLAQLLQATNRLAEAEPLMRRALAIDEQSYGAEHPNVAIRLNNLALLLQATNRLAEAEPLMRRALAIFEQSYGAEHPSVAIDLNNLAQLLQDTNRLAEAEPLMRRALAIDEQSYGAEHPNVARDLNNLARLLQDKWRAPLARDDDEQHVHGPGARATWLAEAEPMLRRAVEIFEASLGPDHPNTQTVAANHRSLLEDIERGAAD